MNTTEILYVYDDPLADWKFPLVERYVKPYITFGVLQHHIHELFFVVLLYQSIFVLSLWLLPVFFKSHIKSLSYKSQVDTSIHVVSMFQCLLILYLIIPMFNHPILNEDHVFAYIPYGGLVTAFALGYFIWDTFISIKYVKYFGIGFLLHGIMSSMVFFIGFYPIIFYYCPIFLLFEISTPFLNLRWFGIRFPNMFSATFNLANNAILILVFFFIRICWGWYQVFNLAYDFVLARGDERFVLSFAAIILGCNFILDCLNVFWFNKMVTVAIKIISEKFKTPKTKF